MEKTKFRKQNGRKFQYLDETEGRPQYALRTTFMTNISNTMSDEKVMLLMGHKAWRSCYDQRNPEQVIKKLNTT